MGGRRGGAAPTWLATLLGAEPLSTQSPKGAQPHGGKLSISHSASPELLDAHGRGAQGGRPASVSPPKPQPGDL
jgi:hypothetical protein